MLGPKTSKERLNKNKKFWGHLLLPLESLLKFLLSSSSAVSLEKLSSPKGFQDGWSRALRLEAAVVSILGAVGVLRLGAEEVARFWAEVVRRFGMEAVAPHCWPDSYTLCWEDCGELDGVALADLQGEYTDQLLKHVHERYSCCEKAVKPIYLRHLQNYLSVMFIYFSLQY